MGSIRRCSAQLVLLGLAAILAAPVAAQAREWQDGDVFVGLQSGKYNVYSNEGTLQETLSQTAAGFAVDCAFDRSGVLHTTAFAFDRVERFIAPHPHGKLDDVTTGDKPESTIFARDGSFYVGHQFNPTSLRKFTGAGSPGPTFSPAHAATLIDLASDQKTIFYTSRDGVVASERQVHRFDVSANADLPDFADLGGTQQTGDLKLLPPGDGSGGLLVAQTTEIKRLDGSGQVVKTYDIPGENTWFGIALDADGESFWAQTNNPGSVFRFSIATGAVDRGPLPSAVGAYGICVKGTKTAAFDNARPSATISSPADGAQFTQGASVPAAFACADDANGTGIKSCTGTLAAGAVIDTASAGTKTFTVEAADNAGNTARRTSTYTVVAPPPPPPPPPELKTPAVAIAFDLLQDPTRVSLFKQVVLENIARGSKVVVRCLTKSGKRCTGRLRKGFTKRNARGTLRLKPFERKRYPVGFRVDATITNPAFKTQFKTLVMRRNAKPNILTRCATPPSKKRQAC